MRQLQQNFMMNSMSARWIRILNSVEKEPNFTLASLSESLNVSQRTLVKDINSIKEYFGGSIVLQAKQTGYKFEEIHHTYYIEKKTELVESEVLFAVIGQIFRGELKPFQELAYEYSYGESTFRRFLLRAGKSLKDYGLRFSFNPVSLVGDEENIRKFFYDFYYLGEHTMHTIRPPKDIHTLVLENLYDYLGNYEVGTGVSASEFYFFVYLMVSRIKQGKRVILPSLTREDVTNEKDFVLLYSLREVLEAEFNVKIPKAEFIWLYLVLVTQRTMDQFEREQLFYLRFNQWPSIKAIAGTYFSNPDFEGWNTKILIGFLASFLVSKSLTYTIHPIWNKQLSEERDDVIINHSEAYHVNKQFLRKHQKLLGLGEAYFDDVVVEFTLFINLLLEAYYPQMSVLFLLAGDSMRIQMLHQQAKQRIGCQHRLHFLPLKELTADRIYDEDIDLVVTNYRPYLWDYSFEKDYLLVNTIPSENDWKRVIEQLNQKVF
ncbi:transcriptional regulator [Enterococcus casseliflavus]|uniref:helix-turn-helix domain-containing protein n=1 Tax=Enterococcus casseliflavus TaxID=37734 RepID=UPI0008E11A0D|nr:helix-turn-helix domain-containing protein [Enterococcus casseliflavus]GEB30332.1 hypothetical protein ECA02_34270 [Enterococcus casseliflavus]SFE55835.1 HTH domain-containing protein [Enterococcus casseliflavus]STP33443.1 transcriptional regulator [Enterococcus casseliflavus]